MSLRLSIQRVAKAPFAKAPWRTWPWRVCLGAARRLVRHPLRRLANRWLPIVLGSMLGLATWTMAGDALARLEAESPYTFAQTYTGALRYLRVDLDCEIIEHDAEAGYMLFKYEAIEGREPSRGSIEVIEIKEDVKIIIRLPDEASHHEAKLRHGLLRKLEAEYGEPPAKDHEADDDDDETDEDQDDDEGDGATPPEPNPGKTKRRRRKRR